MQGLVPASLHNFLPQVCRPCSRREAPHPGAKRATIVTAGESEARGWGQGPHAAQGCAVRADKADRALRCGFNNPSFPVPKQRAPKTHCSFRQARQRPYATRTIAVIVQG